MYSKNPVKLKTLKKGDNFWLLRTAEKFTFIKVVSPRRILVKSVDGKRKVELDYMSNVEKYSDGK